MVEDFCEQRWAARVRGIVKDAVRPFLYSKKYSELDSEEKYTLLCEEITKEICLARL